MRTAYNKNAKAYLERGIWEHWHNKEFSDYTDKFYSDKVQSFCDAELKDNVLLYGKNGTGKCFAKGTRVRMYDGTIKLVEDIVKGNMLMGSDSKPRKVLSTTTGVEQMYRIKQKNGDDYVVNESHILSLKGCGKWKGQVTNITVKDYLKKTKTWKKCNNGYKVGVEYREREIIVDPYYLGVWLGDGSSNGTDVTANEPEIISYLYEYATSIGQSVTPEDDGKRFRIVDNLKSKSNRLLNQMIELDIISSYTISIRAGEKHIPTDYLINSREVRLELLAGLIDSDGHYAKKDVGYEIVQKNFRLAYDIVVLARSLGFRVSIKDKVATLKSRDYTCPVKRITIYGDIDKIPVKVAHKKAKARQINKNPLVHGIEVIKESVDKYYGFTIDGDRLFLLEDFTVVHNTMLMNLAMKEMFKKGYEVYVIDFRHLMKEYIDSWKTDENLIPRLLTVDYLAIDDLGKEFKNQGVSAELANSAIDYVLRYRVQRNKPTWMTFNMSLSDVREVYNIHIASLLKRGSTGLEFKGSDFGDKQFKKVTKK